MLPSINLLSKNRSVRKADLDHSLQAQTVLFGLAIYLHTIWGTFWKHQISCKTSCSLWQGHSRSHVVPWCVFSSYAFLIPHASLYKWTASHSASASTPTLLCSALMQAVIHRLGDSNRTANLLQHHSDTAWHHTQVRPCQFSEMGWSKAHNLPWLWWCGLRWSQTHWEYSVSASFPSGCIASASCRHWKPYRLEVGIKFCYALDCTFSQ